MPTFLVDHRALGASIERSHREKIARAEEAIRTTVKLHGPRIVQQLIDAEDPKPVDRAVYRRSFAADDVPHGVEFYNFAKHGPIVELGRRPGKMPPVDKLTDWVQRKNLVPRGARNRKKARAVAFLIARKIARKGIKGHHILARAARQLTPIVMERARRALGTEE